MDSVLAPPCVHFAHTDARNCSSRFHSSSTTPARSVHCSVSGCVALDVHTVSFYRGSCPCELVRECCACVLHACDEFANEHAVPISPLQACAPRSELCRRAVRRGRSFWFCAPTSMPHAHPSFPEKCRYFTLECYPIGFFHTQQDDAVQGLRDARVRKTIE